jgi:ribosome biogenesis GTPase
VQAALERGELSLLRYSSYLALLDEVEDQNYWERNRHEL